MAFEWIELLVKRRLERSEILEREDAHSWAKDPSIHLADSPELGAALGDDVVKSTIGRVLRRRQNCC